MDLTFRGKESYSIQRGWQGASAHTIHPISSTASNQSVLFTCKLIWYLYKFKHVLKIVGIKIVIRDFYYPDQLNKNNSRCFFWRSFMKSVWNTTAAKMSLSPGLLLILSVNIASSSGSQYPIIWTSRRSVVRPDGSTVSLHPVISSH